MPIHTRAERSKRKRVLGATAQRKLRRNRSERETLTTSRGPRFFASIPTKLSQLRRNIRETPQSIEALLGSRERFRGETHTPPHTIISKAGQPVDPESRGGRLSVKGTMQVFPRSRSTLGRNIRELPQSIVALFGRRRFRPSERSQRNVARRVQPAPQARAAEPGSLLGDVEKLERRKTLFERLFRR